MNWDGNNQVWSGAVTTLLLRQNTWAAVDSLQLCLRSEPLKDWNLDSADAFVPPHHHYSPPPPLHLKYGEKLRLYDFMRLLCQHFSSNLMNINVMKKLA